jgi:NitT/TauT family transport system permease protein
MKLFKTQKIKHTAKIGYLPTVDHLVLGVSHALNKNRFRHVDLEPIRFDNWEEVQEALTNEEIDGAFMLIPMAIKMKKRGVPLKCLSLAHREDLGLIVKNDIKKVKDLKGKTIGITHPLSSHNIFFRKFLKENGLDMRSVKTKEVDAMHWTKDFQKGDIDAYFGPEISLFKIVESSEMGKVFHLPSGEHKDCINCIFVLCGGSKYSSEAIKELTHGFISASKFLVDNPKKSSKIGAKFLNRPRNSIYDYLFHKKTHIASWNLIPKKEEFIELVEHGKMVGIFKTVFHKIDDFIESHFARHAYKNINEKRKKKSNFLKKQKKIIYPLIVFFILFSIWEGLYILDILDVRLLPPPSHVWIVLKEVSFSGVLIEHVMASLGRVFFGFSLAFLVGVPFGLFLGTKPILQDAFNPLVHIMRTISPISWIPLAILWFGIGDAPAIFIIFITAFFPILVSTSLAINEIDPILIKVGKNFGATNNQLLAKVIIPAIFPNIIVGMRISLGISWTIIVAAEMVGMSSGLGFMILDARNFLNTPLIIAGMLVIGVIGFGLDFVLKFIERRVKLGWGKR